jgi:hypothetical protein
MMSDWEELLGLIAFIFGLTLLLVVGVFGPLSYYDCNVKSDIYNVETKYNLVSGCYAKTKESFVPMKLYEKSMMEITNINLLRK